MTKLNKKAILFVLLVGLISIYFLYFLDFNIRNSFQLFENEESNDNSSYLINTPSCKLVDLNPFGPDAKKLWKDVKSSDDICASKSISFINIDSNHTLQYNEKWKETKNQNGSCCYRGIIRIQQNLEKYNNYADSGYNTTDACIPIPPDGIQIHNEFLRIECSFDSVIESENALNSTVKKNTSFQAIVLPPQLKPSTSSLKGKYNFWKNKQKDLPPNILIIGIDSVSKLHMVRSLPLTRKVVQNAGFIEMNGYTKIGDNTLPATMAMLANMNLTEALNCWPKRSKKFDNCPLIWKNFSDHGYVTALIEDEPEMAIFNYAKTGFVQQPTDYYLRPFMLASKKHSSSSCISGMSSTTFLMKYIKDLITQMNQAVKIPYFSFSWFTGISHEYFNTLKTADRSISEFFKELIQNPQYDINNTLTIFLSDHGFRFGKFRESFQGFFEESLPFLFIRLPQQIRGIPSWKRDEWQENLLSNSKKLTSTFDNYGLLFDVLQFTPSRTNTTEAQEVQHYSSILNNISLSRTCENARIPLEYCRCGIHSPIILPKTKFLEWLASFVMSSVNKIVKESSKCAQYLSLLDYSGLKIGETKTKEFMNSTDNFESEDYIIRATVSPGNGIFEARVHYEPGNKNKIIIGSINRINKYKGQSDCVGSNLKKYCYCKQLNKV